MATQAQIDSAARARAVSTRRKHREKWIPELGEALKHIGSSAPNGGFTYLDCDKCGQQVAQYTEAVGIDRILADAISHTCPPAGQDQEGPAK